MLVRKALLHDATSVYDLVNSLSGDGTLLKRPFAEICENIRDFTVAESDGGVFLGCGALHLYGPHLAEVRSIVVKPEAKGQGAGGRLLGALIEEAEEHGLQSVCLFTRIPDFFFKYGFRIVEDKSDLPDKIFKDCQSCPRLHRCDEVAMVRGRQEVVGGQVFQTHPEQLVEDVVHDLTRELMNGVELQVHGAAMAVVVADAGNERADGGLDAELFVQLTGQRQFRAFACLDFAAGKFPLQGHGLVGA